VGRGGILSISLMAREIDNNKENGEKEVADREPQQKQPPKLSKVKGRMNTGKNDWRKRWGAMEKKKKGTRVVLRGLLCLLGGGVTGRLGIAGVSRGI